LQFVEGAALHEGHLQLTAAEHPDVPVVERPQLGDQRIDVGARLQRALRLVDGMRGDDDVALPAIGPCAAFSGDPVIGGASHDDGTDALEETIVVMFPEFGVTAVEQPLQRFSGTGDETVERSGDIAEDARHGRSPGGCWIRRHAALDSPDVLQPDRDCHRHHRTRLERAWCRAAGAAGCRPVSYAGVGAPVGFHIAMEAPEQVLGLVIQNANAHCTGFGPEWAATNAYWE